jgi:hypothetical protein
MMNTQRLALMMAACAGLAWSLSAQGQSVDGASVPLVKKEEAGKWRVSAGVDYRFRFKADVKMSTERYDAAFPPFVPPQNAYPTRDELLGRIGEGGAGDTQRDYDNGGVVRDSAWTGGDGRTWNWSADSAAQYDAASERLTFDGYYGVTEARIGSHETPGRSDSSEMAGVSVDFAREVWRGDTFRLSVSAGGSYFPERELLSVRQSFGAGSYRSEVWRITDTYDVSGWNGMVPDVNGAGGIGAGTFDGPGPLIPFIPVSRTEGLDGVLADETFGGGAWAEADLWLAEGRLCLVPEWQALDRLSLFGTVGVSLGYVGVSTRSGSWMTQNTATAARRSSGSEEEWVVQAILGLGVRFAVTDRVGLSLLGEARLPGKDIDFNAAPYAGEIELGVWSAGVRADYCF